MLEIKAAVLLESLRQDSNYRTLKTNDFRREAIPFNLSSNDYLGLNQDKHFNESFLDSALFKEYCAFSSSSSRLLLESNAEIYALLESFLAQRFHKEALLFNSGYHANVGCIQALSALNPLFIVDKSMHASCLDGLKSFKKTHFIRFAHNSIESLVKILEENAPLYEVVIVASEALFSMEGDFTPLAQLVALKERFSNLFLYIDEAHSIGSYGADGFGLCASLGFLDKVDFIVLTFGKALASVGACMLCSQVFKEYFINTARSLMYSTALPPLNVAHSLFAFLHIANFVEKRAYLAHLSAEFKARLKMHLDVEILGDYNIISIVLKENAKAVYFAQKLLESGYFAPAIKSPTVAKNKALLRFSLCANMKLERLESLVKTLQKIAYANL